MDVSRLRGAAGLIGGAGLGWAIGRWFACRGG